jgi:general stress protein 26
MEEAMSPFATQENPSVIWPKIQRAPIGMFTTRDEHGHLISHPMASQQIDREGVLWFITSDRSHIVHNIFYDPEVNISFAKPDENLFVSVSGHAEEIKDPARVREMWTPLMSAWFPEGEDDPHLSLIKVTVHAAEYWDAEANRMLQVYQLAKAMLTGNPPDVGPSAHGKVILNS